MTKDMGPLLSSFRGSVVPTVACLDVLLLIENLLSAAGQSDLLQYSLN